MRHRRRSRSAILAIVAIGVAAFVPSPAHGAPPAPRDPLLNDAAGDTGYICVEPTDGLPIRCGREVPSTPAPAADLVQGDITLASTDLVFEATVVDLDDSAAHPDGKVWYLMTAVTGDVRIRVDAERGFSDPTAFATVTVQNMLDQRSVSGPATNRLDNGTNTVEWRVELADLNDLIAHVCAGCGDIRRGTTLARIEAYAEAWEPLNFFTVHDWARTNRLYTVGDD